jgi:hypothetical protein
MKMKTSGSFRPGWLGGSFCSWGLCELDSFSVLFWLLMKTSLNLYALCGGYVPHSYASLCYVYYG